MIMNLQADASTRDLQNTKQECQPSHQKFCAVSCYVHNYRSKWWIAIHLYMSVAAYTFLDWLAFTFNTILKVNKKYKSVPPVRAHIPHYP